MSDQHKPQKTPQQQQDPRTRKPAFANWPTLKILTPPEGIHSAKVDEWVFTYCSQSVRGRIHGQEPHCRSIAIRKVFPHEVRNIASFRKHQSIDAEGKARYPLPAEGQTENLPRFLDDRLPDSDDKPATKFWEEGWYFWTSSSLQAANMKTAMMKTDLAKQQTLTKNFRKRRELWQDYQDHLNREGADREALVKQYGGSFTGTVIPLDIPPAERSLLVRLPPDLSPTWKRLERLLTPTASVLRITRDSIASGDHKQLAMLMWKKAQTDEPFKIIQKTCSRLIEHWKARDTADEDDSKKGST